jgi:hypothetical protein
VVSADLRVAENFWPALEAAGNSPTELARRTGILVRTLQTWQINHKAGRVFDGGRWVLREAGVATPSVDLASQLREYLRRCGKQQTVEQLADQFGVPPKDVRGALTTLEQEAALVKVDGDVVALDDTVHPTYKPERIDFRKYVETEMSFGVTGDNHIGSKYERLDVLETLFDRWESEGITTVYQCGNIIDGECKGINENDIYVHGFEGQIANLIEKWPKREGMTTYFITGNCHEGWYIKREHVNVGKRIEQSARDAGRDDLRFLGHLEHDLDFEQEGGKARVRLFHAGGGSAYATSYKPQKIVESYQGGEKPNALWIGHFHKYDTGYPREVWECQVGCTQDQTPWMRQHNIAAHLGGLTVRLQQNSLGIFTSYTVTWMPFYDRKFYAVHWDGRAA